MSNLPPSKPRAAEGEIRNELIALGIELFGVVIFARRAYYSKLFAPDGNNFGVYDDALFVVTPNVFAAFNGNCDPSYKVNPAGRALAQLLPGTYKFYKGKHKGKYNALRAFPEGVTLPCLRNGKPSTCRYINIHYGSDKSTWSEGCLTVPRSQWDAFINLVYGEMARCGVNTVTVVLADK
jgi:hypothetical protein